MSHPEQSTSRKVTSLSDFEYRVWEQTKLSSDDFGVMPFLAATLRAENARLRRASEKQVQDALVTLVTLGLLVRFVHQDEEYVVCPVWQTWQQVRFPRKTSRPKPPDGILAKCDAKTLELFSRHPGGKTFADSSTHKEVKSSESSREDSETSPESSPNSLKPERRLIPADANANANANAPEGSPEGNHSESPQRPPPLIVSPVRFEKAKQSFAFFGDRLKVPHVLHQEFAAKLGKHAGLLPAWYHALNNAAHESGEPIPDVFAWLRPKFVDWASRLAGGDEMAKFVRGEV